MFWSMFLKLTFSISFSYFLSILQVDYRVIFLFNLNTVKFYVSNWKDFEAIPSYSVVLLHYKFLKFVDMLC